MHAIPIDQESVLDAISAIGALTMLMINLTHTNT